MTLHTQLLFRSTQIQQPYIHQSQYWRCHLIQFDHHSNWMGYPKTGIKHPNSCIFHDQEQYQGHLSYHQKRRKVLPFPQMLYSFAVKTYSKMIQKNQMNKKQNI
nr:MAG TPA: hypothetical protein [Caudoviricetes sp.]